MARQATRPDFFSNFASLKRREEEAKKKGLTDEERHLYHLSETSGWKVLTETKNALVAELDSLNDNAISQGMTYEELGKNTVVISLARGIIKRLWDKVADAKEACEGQPGQSGGAGGA